MASQTIADRFQELEAEADRAGATARRHEVARQGAERLKLQAECGQAGHFYAANWNPICMCCGYDRNSAAKTLARNLTVTGYGPSVTYRHP